MLEETSLGEKNAETHNLLAQFKSAINHPSLNVYQFFEDMRNDIDIQSYNKELINEHQAKLIIKVQQFERICVCFPDLDRVNWLLSNELLKVETVLFQDKCMFFLKAAE